MDATKLQGPKAFDSLADLFREKAFIESVTVTNPSSQTSFSNIMRGAERGGATRRDKLPEKVLAT